MAMFLAEGIDPAVELSDKDIRSNRIDYHPSMGQAVNVDTQFDSKKEHYSAHC